MSRRKYKKEDFNIGKNLPVDTNGEFAEEPIEIEEFKKRSFLKRLIVYPLLLIISLFLVLIIWNAVNISRASNKMFGSGNLLQLVNSDPLKTDGRGRVNVLIVGYSVDDPGHPGAKLTDSILVLSMNPDTKTGYMLSVPRDLYLKVPNESYGKVNEVYQDGGMELLKEVIADKLGIDIGYHIVVNYAAVKDTVDALSGITVDIKSSDERGLYDPNISPVDGGPLELTNGPQSLDGQTALNLTRARGATFGSYGFPRSDLTRIDHQKQVFAAIKSKASNLSSVLNPRKNGQLFDAATNNLKTDLQAGEALPMYRLFAGIPADKLQSYSLHLLKGKNQLADYNGGLIPVDGLNDYDSIKQAILQLD